MAIVALLLDAAIPSRLPRVRKSPNPTILTLRVSITGSPIWNASNDDAPSGVAGAASLGSGGVLRVIRPGHTAKERTMAVHRVRSTLARSRALTTLGLGAVALVGAIWGAHSILGTLQAAGQAVRTPTRAASTAPIAIEGPFTHDNLAVYVIRGASDDRRAYITLDQGLAARSVEVREQGAAAGQDQAAVNAVEVENKSAKWLFLHTGDIIKGGKQDRTIMTDVLLAPHSKPQAIEAFCVEHGRWAPAQDGLAFKANPGIVAGTSLKRTIQSEKNQQRVWQEVARAEGRAVTVARAQASADATSSVALSTPPILSSTGTYNAIAENKAVNGGRTAYVNALLPSIRKHTDAVGLAVVINGKMAAADVYTSAALFEALSGKLLESYTLEALLTRGDTQPSGPPSKQQVTTFLANAALPPASAEMVGESMRRSTRENDDAVLYSPRISRSLERARPWCSTRAT